MVLATLLLPVVLAFVVLAVQRFDWPAWLALTVAALGYGVLADRNLQSYGRAFSLGFANAIEQVGLLVAVGAIMAAVLRCCPLPTPWAAAAGAAVGISGSPAGALALLQTAANGAPRRALLLVLTALAAQALIAPSVVAVASVWVVRADMVTSMELGAVLAVMAAGGGWMLLRRYLPPDTVQGQNPRPWLIVAALLVLMIIFALAQVPSEPLGAKAANHFYANLGRPFVVAAIGLVAALVIARGTIRDWHEASWAPLLLTVGASGGLSFVLNETGVPELLAEGIFDPRLGLLAPFLAAAAVKTMQGSSLTAVLTAVGMTEPMLGQLGLDSPSGRLFAASAAGAGSMTLCHINDPIFWIGAHMLRLPTSRALLVLGGGSALVGLIALSLLILVRIVA